MSNNDSINRIPTALIILDGFGLSGREFGNAVKAAKTPNFDRFWQSYPHTTLKASGEDVGLPAGQMGNSEVGHLNIGAGRIVYQSLTRIDRSITDGSFFQNQALMEAIGHAKLNQRTLHVMGLVSDGGVHSHYRHLLAVLEMAKQQGLQKIAIHAFLDGRDVAPNSALGIIKELESALAQLGVGRIATVSGRYYAMDRDKRWERVKLAYEAIVAGGGQVFESAEAGIEASYQQGVCDEFVVPFVVKSPSQAPMTVDDGDSVVFFNFRPDRAIQLSTTLTAEDFEGFIRTKVPKLANFVTFTQYSDHIESAVAFPNQQLDNVLGEVLAKNHKTQLRIAETEKYPHVTFFMNGGRHQEFSGEKRILINSPKVATYNLQPEMSAYQVKDALIQELMTDQLDMVILNFANPDMVGHSGKLEPTIRAVEAVDDCLGEIVDLIIQKGGWALITADHGNAEEVLTEAGLPMTAHTANPVPLILTKAGLELRSDGRLADLAPTILQLLNIAKPAEMTGESLIKCA